MLVPVTAKLAPTPRPPRFAGGPRRLVLGSATAWWGYLLIAVGWLAVVVGVIGLLARSAEWSWQPLIVAAALFPYLTAAAALGGVVLAARRAWAGPATAALLAVIAAVVIIPYYVASAPQVRDGRSLIVLQANLRWGGADPGKLVAEVRTEHADVVTVEELTADELAGLTRAGLSRRLPFHFAVPSAGAAGTGIWSRYPLTATRRHGRFTFELLTARITAPGAAAIQLIAVHLLPPWPYPASTWLREMHRLHRLLAAQPPGVPVVVSGDFNATIDHAQFRGLLTGGYQDGADQAGAGILPTYPTDRLIPPLLAIDHILTRTVDVTNLRILALPGSDHRALLAHLIVPTASHPHGAR